MGTAMVVMLAILIGFQVGDFFAAPQSLGGWIKTEIGMRLIRLDVTEAYVRGGYADVQKLIANPIVKMGVYYTVTMADVSSFSANEDFAAKEVFIEAHHTPFEASLVRGVYFSTPDSELRVDASGQSHAISVNQSLRAYAPPMASDSFYMNKVPI
jgi:hypothetical protein